MYYINNMHFTTVVDFTQWSYIFPNILALETFKRKYTYGIYTACGVTHNLLTTKLKHMSVEYGHVYVSLIPSFFSFFNLDSLTPNHDWITGTTMDRFVVPHFCEHEKYLHIDIDTLIVSDQIFDLEKASTSSRGIAAVPNITPLVEHVVSFSETSFLLDLVKTNKYTFNAGVLLIDCKKTKAHNLDDFVKDVYERGENATYINDEVILNLYDQQFKILDNKYNIKPYFQEDMNLEPEEIVVMHFSGKGFKPWDKTHISKLPGIRKYYGLWEYYYYSAFS